MIRKVFVKVVLAALVAAVVGALAARMTSESGGDGGTVTESSALTPSDYDLTLSNGLVALTEYSGNGCATQLLDPLSLRLDRTVASCTSTSAGTGYSHLVIFFKAAGLEIHVSTTNRSTHRTSTGPLLMTVQNWGWNHSAVIQGEGAIWIYGLDGSKASPLLEVSTATGRVVHRFSVAAGADPYMGVNNDGFWITEGVWGGPSCSSKCSLWHVASGSDRLTVVRHLGVGTQWFAISSHSLYLDELTRVPSGYRQSIWRLDGPAAHISYETPATLLPSDDFGGTGYVVEGNDHQGFFTLSQLGQGHTPLGVGDCNATALLRVVRIDSATGKQTYVASLPKNATGPQTDCHLYPRQAAFTNDSLYLLTDQSGPGFQYGRVVRVQV